MAERDDLLERGFELAYFIVPDKPIAVAILISAMNKLETQRDQESKRNYWRDKYLKRWITRVNRNDDDTLQWLIYFESDYYEKRQEQSGQHTVKDLVVRYIKNLVRMTTAMSSFHVNIGLHRLLCNYSTTETQQIYEYLTERYLGADEYRRAKSVLMSKLEERFGQYLQTVKTGHGEVRFEANHDQGRWASLVDECLRAFTPWSTRDGCLVPANLGPDCEHLSRLLAREGHENIKQDKIETNRYHALIDPICHGRVVKALGLDPPGEKLALPRFLMDGTDNHNTETKPGQSSQSPRLTKEELSTIRDRLAEEFTLRQGASPGVLRVLVDHVEHARIDLIHERELHFEIQEGAELIEIWADNKGKELLLATQLISYAQGQGIAPATSTISIKGGKKLVLAIAPAVASNDVRSAAVSLVYFSDSHALARNGNRSRFSQWFGPVPRFALASAVLVAVGWGVGSSMYQHELSAQSIALERVNRELAREKSERASLPKHLEITGGTTETALSYTLLADDSIVRGAGGPAQPTVTVPDRPALVNLTLPIGNDTHALYRAVLKPFLEEKEILSENLLRAQSTAAGPVVLFAVPSMFLAHNKDYMVDLKYITSKGGLTELTTFTFHVTRKKN